MKKINHYDIRILKNGEKKFDINRVEVLASNDTFTVLNDHYYTKLAIKGDDFANSKIGKSHISEWKMGIDSLDGIHYTLYTYKTRRPATIKKEIQTFINKNYSFMFQVDLSFIK